MIERIKSTIRHTLIYSLSNIAPKAVGVVLLPLYTAKLAQYDFGNWDLIDITIQILSEILILGQASVLILLNNSDEYKEKKGAALFTITSFVFMICLLLVLLAELFLILFADLFTNSLIRPVYVQGSAYIIALKIMNNLFLAKVRADEESAFFSLVSIIRVLVTTGITILLVAYYEKGIEGILYAAIMGEISAMVFLLVKIIPQLETRFNRDILLVGLKFGIPLVIGSAGFMILNLSDRYIIKLLLGANANAIYGLGYRIAGVLNMFLVLPFSLGLLPVAYKYFGKEGDTRFFSKLMTYSTFIFVWGFIFISLFSREIIRLLSKKPEYESAFAVIPLILLSYVFSGMRLTAQLGMMLTKNTKHVASITLGAAFLNIVLNFIFIPLYGITAAAANTLVAFIIFYIVTQLISGHYYKIPYENRKLFLLIAAGAILTAPVYFLPAQISILTVTIKILLTVLFPVSVLLLGFYEKAEIEILTSPKKLTDFIQSTIKGANETPVAQESNIEK